MKKAKQLMLFNIIILIIVICLTLLIPINIILNIMLLFVGIVNILLNYKIIKGEKL